MKFCKNLQRVVEISDPEWAPYWINYKQLKKLIKGIISSSSPSHQGSNAATASTESRPSGDSQPESSCGNNDNNNNIVPAADQAPAAVEGTTSTTTTTTRPAGDYQSNGDETSERRQAVGQQSQNEDAQGTTSTSGGAAAQDGNDVTVNRLGSSPGEIAFFKLLHTEVKKASHFFEQAQKEYAIREERVRKGMELIKNERDERPTNDAFEEQWSRLVQSIFRLYRELLLLETFAIMNYCGFSKILKKHDKNTGFSTRNAFMAKVVNQANFTNYPHVLQMINRCERLYEEASNRLAQDGKNALHEDERLFIHMIHRLNAQVVGVDANDSTSKVNAPSTGANQGFPLPVSFTPFIKESWKAQSLKELVAENDASLQGEAKRHNNEDDDSDSDGEGDTKPKATQKSQNPDGGAARKRKASDAASNEGDDDDDDDDNKGPHNNKSKRQKDSSS